MGEVLGGGPFVGFPGRDVGAALLVALVEGGGQCRVVEHLGQGRQADAGGEGSGLDWITAAVGVEA